MFPNYVACYWQNRQWNCESDLSLKNANKKAQEKYGENQYSTLELHPTQMPEKLELGKTRVMLYHPKYSYEHVPPIDF